jgi:hypothetical protein
MDRDVFLFLATLILGGFGFMLAYALDDLHQRNKDNGDDLDRELEELIKGEK